MDAVDGKQARRTKSSSPLGQLFDHGCDSFTGIINSVSMMSMVCLPEELCPVFFAFNFFMFYASNLNENYTGTMKT